MPAARLAERVELVDKYDARGARLGLGEQVADPAGADADEHLDEIRARHAEKRHLGLARDRLAQQRLASTRRPDQQHTLGDAAAQGMVLFRVLEKIDDLAQLGDRLVDAGHVLAVDAKVFLSLPPSL